MALIMKRLCIYVTYDFENIADDYIGCMLHELRKIVDFLAVVCNYEHISDGMENIQPYADRIFFRKNIGFDAGAYKDALCQYLGWDFICQYDELLLVNDSFYGPIYSIEDLYRTMQNENADYWGMTRAPKGTFVNGYQYNSHIQSYFLVLRKTIIKTDLFKKFWIEMKYPETLEQAVMAYEIGMNQYLAGCGYTGIAVTDVLPLKYCLKESENPYLLCSLELIRDIRLPIFKRKSLKLENRGFGDALLAFEFIHNNSSYDVKYIIKHLLRQERRINSMGLDRFCEIHSKVFIYGAGLYGRNLSRYFKYRGWGHEKFLVTNADGEPEDCISFDMADIAADDGIIIAVGNKKIFAEILNTVKKRCNKDQIYNFGHIF